MRTTRLAPSPTGALHLGNARSFLVNWLVARQNGWRIILRIEDIDGPRIKRGAGLAIIQDLRWLGLDWDSDPVYQSERRLFHDAALQKLLSQSHAYPCICSRSEVEAAASAPHSEDGSTVYPGTCRGRFANIEDATNAADGRAPAVRFAVPNARVDFVDAFAGPKQFDVERQLGDFVIAKADGTPAYQLAVVVDDADCHITDVIRGDDLLDSTPRQILLYQALGRSDQIPTYCHIPLIVGPDGRRLAKRHGDTRLASLRENGIEAETIVAMLARWCGIEGVGSKVRASELVGRFDLARMPRERITFDLRTMGW